MQNKPEDDHDRLALALSALHPQGNGWLAKRIGCSSTEVAGGQRGRRALKKYLPALRKELGLDEKGFVAGRMDTWVARDHGLLLQRAPAELRIYPLLRVLPDAEARYLALQASIDPEWTSGQAHYEALPDGGGPDDTPVLEEPMEDNILDFDYDLDFDLAHEERSKTIGQLPSRTSKDHPDMGIVPTAYTAPARRVPQQYVLAIAQWNGTQRYVVLRGDPDDIEPMMNHFVEHGTAPQELPYVRLREGRHVRLNELWNINVLDGAAKEFGTALDRLEKDHRGLWGSVRAVNKALNEWVDLLEDPEPRRGTAKRSLPEDPDQLIRKAIADIYELEPDPEKPAEMVGVLHNGVKVPVVISIGSGSEFKLEPVSNPKTYLIAVKNRSIRGMAIFQIIFDGPRSMLPASMVRPSTVSLEELCREKVPMQQQLQAGR